MNPFSYLGSNLVTDVILSWSGGKDSSLALKESLGNSGVKVRGLLSTVTKDYDRISMHGVRRVLLQEQASSLGLPLFEVFIPKNATNEIYERETKAALSQVMTEYSISAVVFGDIFLQDIREYREKLVSTLRIGCLFPIWGRNTKELANEFIDSGFRAILCTIDPKKMGPEFCGREFDRKLLSDLPSKVDPCGENGEFHTFVYDGPIFRKPINITRGEVVQRDGFYFADIIPSQDC